MISQTQIEEISKELDRKFDLAKNHKQPFRCNDDVAVSFGAFGKANDIQHGGTHYKQFKGFEPWDVITEWKLGYLEGTALKYIARWRYKNGVEDLKKAIHFLQKAIEVENEKAKP